MFTKPYSEDTARVIDEEVSKLIESQYQRALQILAENKDKLSALADKLLTNEVIFKEDLELIFGKRQWETEEITHPSETEESLSENNDEIVEQDKEIEQGSSDDITESDNAPTEENTELDKDNEGDKSQS
jgi:cell division protease FtsH